MRRRDWMALVLDELPDVNRGLFTTKDGRTIHPNSDSQIAGGDHLGYFALLGRLVGCALYHREQVPAAAWSLAFVKGAFGYPILLSDLEAVDRSLYDQKVLYLQDQLYASRDGVEIGALEMTFEVDMDHAEYADAKRKRATHELKRHGSEIAVTEDNKQEYLQLFVEHRVVRSVETQLAAFKSGLHVFFTPDLLVKVRARCTAAQIQLLLSGAGEIDVDDWATSTKYQGGFAPDHAEVRWFWEIVRGMAPQKQAQLLHFCTGSSQPPAAGFANLMGYSGDQERFTIQMAGVDVGRLPSAATCFNQLQLPKYQSKDQMQDRLLAAMALGAGFETV